MFLPLVGFVALLNFGPWLTAADSTTPVEAKPTAPRPATSASINKIDMYLDGGSIVCTLVVNGDQSHRLFRNHGLMSSTPGQVSLDGVPVVAGSEQDTWLRAALCLVRGSEKEQAEALRFINALDQRRNELREAATLGPLTPEAATAIARETLQSVFGSVALNQIMGSAYPMPQAVITTDKLVIVRFARPDITAPEGMMYMPIAIDRTTRRVLGMIGWSHSPEPMLNE